MINLVAVQNSFEILVQQSSWYVIVTLFIIIQKCSLAKMLLSLLSPSSLKSKNLTCSLQHLPARQHFPDLVVLHLERRLRPAVHAQQDEWGADGPGREGAQDEEVAHVDVEEEVEVGEDGHQEERGTEQGVETPAVAWGEQ